MEIGKAQQKKAIYINFKECFYMEIGNTQKTKTLFILVNFTEYGDSNTQTNQALVRSTLRKGFVMEMCNTQTTAQHLDKL